MEALVQLLVFALFASAGLVTAEANADEDLVECMDVRGERQRGMMISELKKITDRLSSWEDKCFPAATSDQFPECHCPVSRGMFASFRNHTYMLPLDKLTWHNARQRCQQCGYSLVRVESWEEQEFIKNWFAEAGVPAIASAGPYKLVWMDGTNHGHESCWVWTHPQVTPVAQTFAQWANGQPNDPSGSQCMALWGDQTWSWADHPCSTQCMYLCKRPNGETVNRITPLGEATDPDAC